MKSFIYENAESSACRSGIVCAFKQGKNKPAGCLATCCLLPIVQQSCCCCSLIVSYYPALSAQDPEITISELSVNSH